MAHVSPQEERYTGDKPSMASVQAAVLLVQRRMLVHDGTCLQVEILRKLVMRSQRRST